MAATTLKEAIFQALNKAASAFYTPQTLTPEQKEQARNNIGAMSADTSTSVPAGTLLPFAGTAVPDGYLLCNGANVSRTDYANLFAAIGTKWGEGDGSTTFTLPNFNDRFIEGTTDTEKVGQYLEAGAPNISGSFRLERPMLDWATTGPFSEKYAGTYRYSFTGSYDTNRNDTISFDASTVNSLYTNTTIQPHSGYALIIIKA